jgi:glycosyltransferase involved in cell wall biosynthesis
MKLSILILTHNRPILFKRCINSVLNNLPNFDIEILVNNDSKDITEIYHDNVNIFYYYKLWFKT